MTRRDLRGDRGSATVLTVGVVAALLTVTMASLVVLGAVRAAHRARSAADLAALAGAVEYQLVPDAAGACAEAARVASANDAQLPSCRVGSGGEVTVTTSVPIPLRPAWLGPERAEGRARAGPA